MITIQDVAKTAGVSVASVSRVINNSSAVAPKTREKVLQVINTLNYQPNLLGRNLRRLEARRILVLLPTISNPFYTNIVRGIEDIARKNGFNVMLCNTDSDVNREKDYLEILKNRLSDGVIMMGPELSVEELTDLVEKFPVIQCCEYIEGVKGVHVSIDNFVAAVKAVNHLIRMGHKRIGLISCKNRFISTTQRIEGYKEALKAADITFDASLIQYVDDYDFKSGYRIMQPFLERKDRPTAIFALSDVVAIGAMRRIKESGLSIPEDIAVVGFDDISFAAMSNPSLTTIFQPQYDIGCVAMNLLIKQMQGQTVDTTAIYLEHELIIRESTMK
ncbi:LacI family DNA-binding transcriptional regulator [Pelosinus sp. UFO1]|uniref:LacI family DNA-binding transcriptional regulator n=1 Tax=Pelosinus sp. UFO1 TaxID=484770 RepID=UPI0004D166E2|nr:LacI family DNA-binding transcriptional regulator [Pelosinus sp. UFO1]AIF53004.1 transcriptional regulator, LacI family [Pelosinus sp. UFO1]